MADHMTIKETRYSMTLIILWQSRLIQNNHNKLVTVEMGSGRKWWDWVHL